MGGQQGRLHKKRAWGRDLSKGHLGCDFDVIPRDGFSRRSLGRCLLEILKFTKVTKSGGLTISGEGYQQHIKQQCNKMGVFTLWAKANLPVKCAHN